MLSSPSPTTTLPFSPVSAGFARRFLIRAIAAPLALMVLLSGILVWEVRLLLDASHRVDHSDRVIAATHNAEKLLVDMETGVRGYLVAGDRAFLEPYNRSLLVVDQALSDLGGLTVDNPGQGARVEELRSKLSRWKQFALRVIGLREHGGDYQSVVLSREGKDQMDAMRTTVAEMIRAEETLRTGRQRDAETLAQVVLWGTVLLALSLGAALGVMSRRELSHVSTTYETALEERRRAEAELQRAHDELEERVRERTAELASVNDQLRRSNRELEDFANVASHDLQEPLRKIQAFGDRLKVKCADALSDEGRDYLNRMQKAADRMQTLIRDLLQFSRVTTKAQPFAAVDLGRIIREVLGDLETRIEQTGGQVEVGGLPPLDADALQMRQLFQNLISNALKFHKPDQPPRVRVMGVVLPPEHHGAPEMVELCVDDNGIGFDEKYLDRIFTPFQRLHQRNEYEGTGIGLAVCRKIVERHGGTLTARSKPGEGSTFIVRLPRRASGENSQ